MYYYDVVKSTYNNNLTARYNSEFVIGGYKDKDEACQRARELIWENDLRDNEVYEVEQHYKDSGLLECIIEP